MGIFGKLFKQKSSAADDSVRAAPHADEPAHRTIHYDPNLVDSLKRDHGELVTLYQRIGNLLQDGHHDEIRGELVNFKTRLEAHILTENVRFYTYLEQSLREDAHNAELMRDFRREMNTIARGAVNFVKKYQGPGTLDASSHEEFAKDYAAVGELLAQRIGREESSLYPLYQHD
ncbi:hemerythrin domain-containing protein [Rhodanobacter sp. DHG33]|uniref:hemerythrin domain-containing protein n=1 Tax=Rhodanobacter sp. DHG33 TaxID=2775921 RepID=UPI001786A212|nr:hemerythrin domain-containing protein [Rhodanobacter sp. DHG33]MBD8899908.1 hemerythrin domain-containing protein [Rhodanobacter sp. DHG33]